MKIRKFYVCVVVIRYAYNSIIKCLTADVSKFSVDFIMKTKLFSHIWAISKGLSRPTFRTLNLNVFGESFCSVP